MRSIHVPISNGAVVSTYIQSEPGPHTLIVAGQHGNETGPIEALAGYQPRFLRGTVTLVRCANPWGYALDSRRYATSTIIGGESSMAGDLLDMNRGWGRDPVNAAIWAAVKKHGLPTRVADLHSSRLPWSAGDGVEYKGRQVLAVLEHGLSWAAEIAAGGMAMGEMDGWRASVFEHPSGSLAWFAVEQSVGVLGQPLAAAVTVEFDESIDIEADVLGNPEEGYPSGQRDRDADVRRRTRLERQFGVRAVVDAILHDQGRPA